MKMKLIKKKEVIDMKLMIASDIHGSAFYCEKMIEAYKREGADRLLCTQRSDCNAESIEKRVIVCEGKL